MGGNVVVGNGDDESVGVDVNGLVKSSATQIISRNSNELHPSCISDCSSELQSCSSSYKEMMPSSSKSKTRNQYSNAAVDVLSSSDRMKSKSS